MSDLATSRGPSPAGHGRSRLAGAMVFVATMGGLVLLVRLGAAPIAAVLVLLAWAVVLVWREIPWHVVFGFYLGLLLFIPVNIYRFPVALPLDLEPQRLALFLIALAWAAALLVDPRTHLKPTGLGGPALLLVGTAVISLVVNSGDMVPGDGLKAVKAFAVLVSVLLVCLIAAATSSELDAARRVARWLVSIAAVLSLSAFFERITKVNLFRMLHSVIPILSMKSGLELADTVLYRGGGLRVSGSAEHPIAFGAVLALLFPFAAYGLSRAKTHRARFGNTVACGLIAGAAMLTGSRTAVVGLAVTLAFIVWDQPKFRVAIVSAGLVGLFLIHMAFPGTLGGFRATLNPSYVAARELNNPGHGRGSAYPVVLQSVRARPLVGIGFGRWDPVNMAFTDNQFLQMTAELGFFGLLGFVWFVGVAVVMPWRARKIVPEESALLTAFAASCAAFGAMSLTYDTLGFPQGTYLFFALAGIGCGLAMGLRRKRAVDREEVGARA